MNDKIKLQLPDKKGTYLCRLSSCMVCFAYYNAKGKYWVEQWGCQILNVTAWQEIPDPSSWVEVVSRETHIKQTKGD